MILNVIIGSKFHYTKNNMLFWKTCNNTYMPRA